MLRSFVCCIAVIMFVQRIFLYSIDKFHLKDFVHTYPISYIFDIVHISLSCVPELEVQLNHISIKSFSRKHISSLFLHNRPRIKRKKCDVLMCSNKVNCCALICWSLQTRLISLAFFILP